MLQRLPKGKMNIDLKKNNRPDFELEYNDIEHDTGYGVYSGDLYLDVYPIYTNETFHAHGPGGNLQRYGDSNALTDFEIESGTLFLVGNNGVELGEIELSHSEILELVDHDTILQDLIKKHC